MNDFEAKWQRLLRAARQAPDAPDVAVPPGFATRIAARALSEERPAWLAVFGRFSVRVLWIACLFMLISMAANYLGNSSSGDNDPALLDPVSELLASS